MNWVRCLLREFAAATVSLALGARLQVPLRGDRHHRHHRLAAIDVRINGNDLAPLGEWRVIHSEPSKTSAWGARIHLKLAIVMPRLW
jgi:hypothetical protein